MVAPCTGAWIEIFRKAGPCRLCPVAPCTGAWIEIFKYDGDYIFASVAPCTGAWIEIGNPLLTMAVNNGRTLHGCVD